MKVYLSVNYRGPLIREFTVLSFLFINKTLRLSNLKARIAMNPKISVFVTSVEAIIYSLLCKLHDCTFKTIHCFFL